MAIKRAFPVFLALVLISGAFFLPSCKSKVSTLGTLSVTARAKTGLVGGGTPVKINLATSWENLESHTYIYSNWSDPNGSTIFRDLPPTFYWYGVDGWHDYGAVEVFAGIDASVVLWLNSPDTLKMK